MPVTFDVCVIGHVTQDRIEIAGEALRSQPGGTAYYASVAARRLGLRTAVVTKARPADRDNLLADLEAMGIEVRCLPSPATTEFVNIYPDPGLDTRHQKVAAVASPFFAEDLDIDAAMYLLGPLTRHELSVDCVQHLAGKGGRLALDVQGLLRDIRGGQVVLSPNEELLPLLACVDVVKASSEEAQRITGAPTVESAARILGSAGPGEVLITSGGQGSHLFDGEHVFAIPAYPPERMIDTTGCGDTYLAAYLARRLAGDSVERAGHFAAATASLKIANHGAFRGTEAEVILAAPFYMEMHAWLQKRYR